MGKKLALANLMKQLVDAASPEGKDLRPMRRNTVSGDFVQRIEIETDADIDIDEAGNLTLDLGVTTPPISAMGVDLGVEAGTKLQAITKSANKIRVFAQYQGVINRAETPDDE